MATSNFGPRSPQQAVTGSNRMAAELLHGKVSIRFMSPIRNVPESIVHHLSTVDQTNHIAYLAETWMDGQSIMIAEARYVIEKRRAHECEFAIAVTDTWQGYGIGRELLGLLEQHAVQSGRSELTADTLPENNAMIGLAKRCGFSVGRNHHDFKVKRLTKQFTLH
jgi:acetyltransferase